MKIKNAMFAAATVALLNVSTAAFASPIYNLVNGTGFSGLSNFGTVTLEDVGNTVNVTVQLAPGGVFANTGSGQTGGVAFGLNLGTGFQIALTGTYSNMYYTAVDPVSTLNQNPYGTFNSGVRFKAGDDTGAKLIYGSPITFTVSKVGYNVNYSDFTTLSNGTGNQPGYLFSADVGFKLNGSDVFSTGNVATGTSRSTPDGETTPVPEPTTLALLGLGLLGFAAARRRKN